MVLNGDAPEVLARFQSELEVVEIVARQFFSAVCNLIELDDLRSAGREGLFDAARRFDPERGTSFRTYANIRVRGALFDYLRKAGGLPRRAYQRVVSLEAALAMRDGAITAAVDSERPQAEGDSEALLLDRISARATACALALVAENTRVEGGTREFGAASPEEALAKAELFAVIERELAQFGLDREAEVIRLHYFEGLSLEGDCGEARYRSILGEPPAQQGHSAALETGATRYLRLPLSSSVRKPLSNMPASQ
jgi:RNA polymerase sigma factor for flagellar operon FliA